MIINVNKEELVEAINQVSRAVSINAVMEILNGFRITVLEDKVELFASNMDVSIKATIEAEVIDIGEGSIVIGDGKLFEQFVKKLKDGKITLTTEGNIIKIVNGRNKTDFLIKNAKEYPSIPNVIEENSFSIKGSHLKDLIKKTSFAISSDEIRPTTTGLLFEVKHGVLNLVALDGLRIAHAAKKLDNDVEFSAIISGKGANEILRIINDDDDVTLILGKNHIKVDLESVQLTVRLLEGEFVKYNEIFPSEYKTVVEVNKDEFVYAIERVGLLSKYGNASLVKLLVTDKSIGITSNSQAGKSFDEVDINLTTGIGGLEIAFNSKLLLDGIKAIGSENIVLNFNNSLHPCVVKPLDDSEDYKYLVLPIRIHK